MTEKITNKPAKKITLIILVSYSIIGLLGSFKFLPLDMNAFATFLKAFSLFYIPLITSIGAGSVAKKIKEIKEIKENKEK